jgi:hypothetical protein
MRGLIFNRELKNAAMRCELRHYSDCEDDAPIRNRKDVRPALLFEGSVAADYLLGLSSDCNSVRSRPECRSPKLKEVSGKACVKPYENSILQSLNLPSRAIKTSC